MSLHHKPTVIAARAISHDCTGFLTAGKHYAVSYDEHSNPYITDDQGHELGIALRKSFFINCEDWLVVERGGK